MDRDSEALRQSYMPTWENASNFVVDQVRAIINKYPGYLPMYTVHGKWNKEGERWTHWCEGFFPGILWLLYLARGEQQWRDLAERYTRSLEGRKHDRLVHDLGFIFGSTFLRWYYVSREQHLRDVLIDAGKTLALRRQKGGYLASFIGPQSLFIDIMMNVPLIQWVANETKDAQLAHIAEEHCLVTAKTIVRADGSTAHEGIFDVASGKFVRESTHQGLNDSSAWSRGQAWALYGFTTMSRLSEKHQSDFLATAKKCADYYLQRAPGGTVPQWDFDAPTDSPQPLDSSAAAIACSGLLDLAKLVDAETGARYRNAAYQTLATLCSDEFLAINNQDWEGILMHGVYHYHKKLGVDESVAWGEHFFVEALVKVLTDKKVTF